MKKSLLPLVLTITLVSLSANASETIAPKVDAPKEYLSALIKLCREYVKEDAIPKSEEQAFLLDCVNEDLEIDGYKLLKKVP